MSDAEHSVEPHELAVTAAQVADEKHGADIVVLAVGEVLAVTEYFVIVGASNQRLVRTLVDDVEMIVRDRTRRSPVRTEGVSEQQWVLIDYGDVVVHIFLNEVREYYEIERLYRDVPTVDWQVEGTTTDHDR